MAVTRKRTRKAPVVDVKVELNYVDINSLVPYDFPRNSGKRKYEVVGECFEWRGVSDKDGYGQISVDGRTTRVHRFVYEQLVGPIPAGLLVRHTCNNQTCINPAHLLLGSTEDNVNDRQLAGRQARRATHPKAKLSESDVRRIRCMSGRRKQSAIAALFGITQSTVSRIHLGKNWKEGPHGNT